MAVTGRSRESGSALALCISPCAEYSGAPNSSVAPSYQEGHQDHGGVAMTPTVLPGGLDQPFDLGLGQVFPGPVVRIGPPGRGDCSIFGGWRDHFPAIFCHTIQSP